jgi:hypothetical protein
MRRGAVCVVAAALLGGCGGGGGDGGGQATVTVQETVTERVPSPIASDTEALTGSYALTELEPGQTAGEVTATDANTTEWGFATTCELGACRTRMRREVLAGTFDLVTLEPVPGRRDEYTGTASGPVPCADTPGGFAPADRRYRVRSTGASSIDGVLTTTTLAVTTIAVVRECPPGGRPQRRVARYHGQRLAR